MFTNIINIFQVCVDNFTDLRYNVRKVLLKVRALLGKVPRIILFVILFLAVITFSSLKTGSISGGFNSHADERVADGCGLEISMLSERSEDDTVTVVLRAESKGGFCGADLTLAYDGKLVKPVSVTPRYVSEGFCLSYAYGNGSIRLLLDGGCNSSFAEIALCFSICQGQALYGAVAEFTVSGGRAYAVLCDRLEPIAVSYCALTVELSNKAHNGDAFFVSAIFPEMGDARLKLSGTFSESCFGGFDVIVTDVYEGGVERYFLAGVPQGGKDGRALLECEVALQNNGVYCLSVTPVTYTRTDSVRGEERLLIVRDGMIVENTH